MSRSELIERLTRDMVDSLVNVGENDGYADAICREGFKGFNNMTVEELHEAYYAAFGVAINNYLEG